MAYNFSDLKKKTEDVSIWFLKELQGIRTNRATPLLLDGVFVEAYETKMPVKDIAAIGVEDARTLRISPWDTTQTKAIEKAITASNLGLSVSIDDKGLRVHFPELTSERRTSLKKVVNEKLEQGRIQLRGERDRIWSDIQEKERSGEMSEDDKFRYKEEMQKIIDEGNKKLEKTASEKEAEIGS